MGLVEAAPAAPAQDTPTNAIAAGPTISTVTIQTPGPIEKYAKFEISFDITNTTATNMYFPYDENTPPGVESGTGITVDALFLAPGETNWANARVLPCFYYQPVEEVGSGSNIALLPVGEPEWRCRFTPDIVGTWQYKIRATDAGGTTETPTYEFTCVDSNRKGFVRVSATEPQSFEFSDGSPFPYPLINIEQGNPFNSLYRIRTNIRKMGENGIKFVRWFPTGEGANYFVIPFGDTLRVSWKFGASNIFTDDVDTASGKRFSFRPYYYSGQTIPAVPGATYRLTFRAKVTGERVLRAEINGTRIDICSSTSTYHESNGNNDSCDYKQDGWHDYTLTYTNTANAPTISVYLRGLYVSTDAKSPYNNVQPGSIRMHSIRLQRDETGNGGWGPNLLSRSDPDTYNYVDQVDAAKLDEIFRLSEQYGVYHKLPLFHKNDAVLNRFQPDGTIGDPASYSRNFYSADGQASRWYQRAYTRYFIARWSYSTALHSVELANENHLTTESYEAGFAFAEFVHQISPRPLLVSNSFWGWFVESFWTDPQRGHLLDYADKHWYANETGASCNDSGSSCELISNVWTDSAAYVRECWQRFREYKQQFNYNKPILRGEGGVAQSSTQPQHPDLSSDTPQGSYEHKVVYYHKKLWAHVGSLGYTCDGEWYPRLFLSTNTGENEALWAIYGTYERFMQGEPLNNGSYEEIGTDLQGSAQVLVTGDPSGRLRAWGVRDAQTGRVLLWIDNANHTWRNVANGASISPVSGDLTIQGLPQGTYTAEWWDTYTGTVTGTSTYTVGADGTLSFTVNALGTDMAVKIYRSTSANSTSTPTPTATPTSTPTPTPTSTPTSPPTPTPVPTSTPTPTPTPTIDGSQVALIVTPTSLTVTAGETFTLTVQVRANAQLVDGAAAYLDFDPAVLQVVSITPGSTLNTTIQNDFDNANGRINYAAGLLGSTTSGTFTLAQIAFQATSGTTGTSITFSTQDPRRSDITLHGSSVLQRTAGATIAIGDATLQGQVQLQGRPPAPHERWRAHLSISLTVPGESSPRYTFASTASDRGQLTLTGLLPGTYDIRVKNRHTLRNRRVVTLTSGVNLVYLGELQEGDINDDNAIDILDFSLLAAAFAKCQNVSGFDDRADLNEDACVDLLDFSLLAMNFGESGDQLVEDVGSGQTSIPEPSVTLAAIPTVRHLVAGQVFDLILQVQAGAQPVDAAAAYLVFDPSALRVLSVTPGTALGTILQNEFDNADGRVHYAAGLLDGTASGTFTLARITFQVIQATPDMRITLSSFKPYRSDVTYQGRSVLARAQEIRLTAMRARYRSYLPAVQN